MLIYVYMYIIYAITNIYDIHTCTLNMHYIIINTYTLYLHTMTHEYYSHIGTGGADAVHARNARHGASLQPCCATGVLPCVAVLQCFSVAAVCCSVAVLRCVVVVQCRAVCCGVAVYTHVCTHLYHTDYMYYVTSLRLLRRK